MKRQEVWRWTRSDVLCLFFFSIILGNMTKEVSVTIIDDADGRFHESEKMLKDLETIRFDDGLRDRDSFEESTRCLWWRENLSSHTEDVLRDTSLKGWVTTRIVNVTMKISTRVRLRYELDDDVDDKWIHWISVPGTVSKVFYPFRGHFSTEGHVSYLLDIIMTTAPAHLSLVIDFKV